MSLEAKTIEAHNAARTSVVSSDLSDRAKVELTGSDRAAFLHNFCTNDIKNLPVGRGCEAFLCNAKGKVLAYVRVFALADALWLDAAPGLGPKIVEHLSRFVITEDVTVADRSLARIQRLIAGPGAAATLNLGGPPLQPMEVRSLNLPTPLYADAGEVRKTDELAIPCYHVFLP